MNDETWGIEDRMQFGVPDDTTGPAFRTEGGLQRLEHGGLRAFLLERPSLVWDLLGRPLWGLLGDTRLGPERGASSLHRTIR